MLLYIYKLVLLVTEGLLNDAIVYSLCCSEHA